METRQVKFSLVNYGELFTTRLKNERIFPRFLTRAAAGRRVVPNLFAPSDPGEDTSQPDEDDAEDNSLENLVRQEREDARRRLREELKREPTEEELDEWLQQHTEGY